jgi:hypothetical protein
MRTAAPERIGKTSGFAADEQGAVSERNREFALVVAEGNDSRRFSLYLAGDTVDRRRHRSRRGSQAWISLSH